MLFHQRDGEGAGGDYIGDGAAGNGAHDGTGDNGDLGRAAALGARQRDGKIPEDLIGAADFQKGAEQDEQEDDIAGGSQGGAPDALIAEDIDDDTLQGISPVAKAAGDVLAQEGIADKDDRHNGQRFAGELVRCGDGDHGGQGAKDDVILIGGDGKTGLETGGIDHDIDRHSNGSGGENEIRPFLLEPGPAGCFSLPVVHQEGEQHAEHIVQRINAQIIHIDDRLAADADILADLDKAHDQRKYGNDDLEDLISAGRNAPRSYFVTHRLTPITKNRSGFIGAGVRLCGKGDRRPALRPAACGFIGSVGSNAWGRHQEGEKPGATSAIWMPCS